MRPVDLWMGVGYAVGLLLSGCTSGEVELSQERPLEVYAEIKSASPVTKADAHAADYDKRTFADADEINITKSGSSATTIAYKWSASASQWRPSSATGQLTTSGSETFTATFPTAFSSILENQTTATGFWSSNQLTASATPEGNKVRFNFAPAAAKVTITITYDGGFTCEGAKITATGITGGNDSKTIQLFKESSSEDTNTHTYCYIGIVSPKTSGAYTITITKKNLTTNATTDESKTFNLSDLPAVDGKRAFVGGYNYRYNLTSAGFLILTGDVTVTAFGDPTNQTGDGGLDAT